MENKEDLIKDVLICITDRIISDIKIGNIGAFMYDSNDSFGYDLVKFDSEPYTIQYNCNKHNIRRGDRVVDVTNLYRMKQKNNWYSSSATKSIMKSFTSHRC